VVADGSDEIWRPAPTLDRAPRRLRPPLHVLIFFRRRVTVTPYGMSRTSVTRASRGHCKGNTLEKLQHHDKKCWFISMMLRRFSVLTSFQLLVIVIGHFRWRQ
jgi:hypothetical protein